MGDAAREAELGIVPVGERLSVARCLTRGHWRVTAPAVAIMLGGLCLTPFLSLSSILEGRGLALGLLVISWPVWLAWLYWSVAVPKWRIWALRMVDDWRRLEARAVATLLIWPRGWIFEKTEIASRAERALQRDLIAYRDAHG
jgi:hypothetical protein